MAPAHFKDGAGSGSSEQTDVARMHAAIYREQLEPQDGHEALPTPWLLCMLALALMSGWYLGTYSGGFSTQALDGDPARNTGVEAAVATAVPVDPKVLGARVYNSCMACHQEHGRGVAGQFPPLAKSEWVLGDPKTLARILLHGLQGEVSVAGQTYDGLMPAWERLSDEQIAAVLTYVRGAFGNAAPPLAPDVIAAERAASQGRKQAWTQAELQAVAARP